MAKKKRQIYLLNKLQSKETLSERELKELEKWFRNNTPSGVVKTQKEVARIFNTSLRTVANWMKKGMPRTKNGHYDLSAIHEWKVFNSKDDENKEDKEVKNWDREYRKYKALLVKMEYEKIKKSVVSIEDVAKNNIQKILAVKRKLLSLPRVVAPQLVGLSVRKIEQILRMRVEEIINDFARGASRD